MLSLKETPEEFEAEARLLLAVKLYELGRLTTGRAAELAGMGRVEFMFALGRFGLSPGVSTRRSWSKTSPMPEGRQVVVVNATPLITLALVDRIHLLRDLYDKVVIPPAVFQRIDGSSLIRILSMCFPTRQRGLQNSKVW